MSNQCYIYYNGSVVTSSLNAPCGMTNSTNPNVPCCWKGDTCLSDGICRYTSAIAGASGYYAAGCTDSKFGDGCRRLCVDSTYPDVVYDATSPLWHCCSYPPGGKLNCSNPTSEQFAAPAPSALAIVQALPKSGTQTYATSAASSTSTDTSSSPPSPSQASSGSRGLSAGASAGIGVGAGLGALAIASVILFFFYRRRNRQRNPDASSPADVRPETSLLHRAPSPPEQKGPAELQTVGPVVRVAELA